MVVLGVGGWRAFEVTLPDGSRYWTVVDGDYRPVPLIDGFLQARFFGHHLSEGSTQTYAGCLVLFLVWLRRSGHDLADAPSFFGRFMTFLKHYDPEAPDRPVGPGLKAVRAGRRGNVVLCAVRELYKYAVEQRVVPDDVLNALYQLTPRPLHAGGRDFRPSTELIARPRHVFPVEESGVDNATIEEIEALCAVTLNSRDRFLIALLSLAGLRRGEALGLRVEDLHFMPDSTVLGCGYRGAHLHVRKRVNANRARAKSRNRTVPAHTALVAVFDDYWPERAAVPQARDSDYVLVNLYAQPLGAPMALKSANDTLEALSRRAGLPRIIQPHMLRHSFSTEVLDAGGEIDVLQVLLGHQRLTSTQVYVHPSEERRRAAVEALPFPNVGGRA